MSLDRRHSVAVKVGSVTIGGHNPIVIQSMTNTDTADADATTKQVQELAVAGSELVRITVNTNEAAAEVASAMVEANPESAGDIMAGVANGNPDSAVELIAFFPFL